VSRGELSLRWLLCALLAAALGYGVLRAVQLRIEYFDGYDYLRNASALAGDPFAEYQRLRPPFVPIVQLPAMAIVRASPPAAPIRLVAPHLVSASLSLLSAGAVFWLLSRRFDPTLALLGTLLFATTRYFVHYAPHVMADIPSAGWAAASCALYLRARARRSAAAWTLCGVALAAAVLTKYPLAVLGPAWVLAELWRSAAARRVDAGAWLGIAIVGAVCIATFLAVEASLLIAIHGTAGLAQLAPTLIEFATMTGLGAEPEETWSDYGAMSVAMLSLPTLLLCACGVILTLRRGDERDAVALASLVCVGGTVVFMLQHNEARYLLPAVPFILYFSVRAIEAAAGALRARWPGLSRPARALALLLAAAALAPPIGVGLDQARLDTDPVYRADIERRAAEQLLAARRSEGRLLWSGLHHTLRTRWAGRVPHDEFLGIFHFPPFGVSYLLDQRLEPLRPPPGARPGAGIELASVLRDGDAVLRFAGADSDTRPPAGAEAAPMEIWAASRLRFRALGGGEFAAIGDPAARLRLHVNAGSASVSACGPTGRWQLTWIGASSASRRPAGMITLAPEVAAPLADAPNEPVRAIELFRIERASVD
jgi:hypothetical protein